MLETKFYTWSLKYLELRPHSSQEIKTYLQQKFRRNIKWHSAWVGLKPDEAIESTLSKLQELKLVDDTAFAKSWVESRGSTRSKRRLQQELAKKGIKFDASKTIVESGAVPEEASLAALALKIGHRYAKLAPKIGRQRLTSFLLRRGYEYEAVRRVVDEVLGRP
ncbi:MAG: regulatory protein RecX [candidate division WWE3 bacterium]|nr:regulatory protein RecX [candidate division WWE3 bacterium]